MRIGQNKDLLLEFSFGGDMQVKVNGVAWKDLRAVVKELPVRKLFSKYMIRDWPAGAKILCTEYVFLYSGELIAVKIYYDRSTFKGTMTVATGGQFDLDTQANTIVIFAEKPFFTEIDAELGITPFKMTVGAETKQSKTIKITALYSDAAQNFTVSVDFVPFILMAPAEKATEQSGTTVEPVIVHA